jgi:hypothetical protein
MSLGKGRGTGNVVCEQREWDALEAAHPGHHTLLHAGLRTEQEAERLARGTSGDNYNVRGKKVKPVAPPPLTIADL